MLKYIVMVLLCALTCCNATTEPSIDTMINLLPGKTLLNGANHLGNLTPGQQIIYIYGPQYWKAQNSINLIEKAGSDYLITPGIGAHKLHPRKMTWNKARRICLQEEGHLAIINSNSEEKILLRILEENKVSAAWLGVHDLYEEGDWSSVMDVPLESTGYSKWNLKNGNQPDNQSNKQHCGSLAKDGGMNDDDCNLIQYFFCEIDL